MLQEYSFTLPFIYVSIGLAVLVGAYLLWIYFRKRTSVVAVPLAGAGLAVIIRRLRAENAQWPQILVKLNPRNDIAIGKLLLELRGPHMFMPHTALNILEDACRSTLRRNPHAKLRDVLYNACRSMRSVTEYGN